MYNIWIYDKNKGVGKPAKTDLSISEAFDYVSLAQENLKPNQQLISQEIKTGNVDMIFEKNSTTTPKYPMRFNKYGVLMRPNQMNDSNWKRSEASKNSKSKPKMGIDWQKEKKIDALAKKMRLTNKETDKMTNRTFYSYTIGKQNEQLTDKQYQRFQKLFKDPSFKRPTKPLSKYPTAFEVFNKKEKDYQKYMSKAKPRPNMMKPKKSRGKWIGNMFRASNKKLTQVSRSGTPKQKLLAKKILKNRK